MLSARCAILLRNVCISVISALLLLMQMVEHVQLLFCTQVLLVPSARRPGMLTQILDSHGDVLVAHKMVCKTEWQAFSQLIAILSDVQALAKESLSTLHKQRQALQHQQSSLLAAFCMQAKGRSAAILSRAATWCNLWCSLHNLTVCQAVANGPQTFKDAGGRFHSIYFFLSM